MGLTEEPTVTNLVDMWSLGCLATWLTIHDLLIQPQQMYRFSIGRLPLDINKLTSRGVSDEAVSFISVMLSKTPSERLTAAQALQHPWLQALGITIESDDSSSISSLQSILPTKPDIFHDPETRGAIIPDPQESSKFSEVNSAGLSPPAKNTRNELGKEIVLFDTEFLDPSFTHPPPPPPSPVRGMKLGSPTKNPANVLSGDVYNQVL